MSKFARNVKCVTNCLCCVGVCKLTSTCGKRYFQRSSSMRPMVTSLYFQPV